MKAEIQKILFSRNQCSVADVKEMLTQGAIEAGELAAVLGKVVADGVTAERVLPSLKCSVTAASMRGRTKVTLWSCGGVPRRAKPRLSVPCCRSRA